MTLNWVVGDDPQIMIWEVGDGRKIFGKWEKKLNWEPFNLDLVGCKFFIFGKWEMELKKWEVGNSNPMSWVPCYTII